MEKSKIIEKLFYDIVTFSYLVLPALYLLSNPKTKYTFLLCMYGIVAFTLLLSFPTLPKYLKKIHVSVYTIFEYISFASILFFAITNKKYRSIIIALSIGFSTFQVFYFMTTKIGRLDSIPVGIETILIFFYIFLLLYEQFKNPEVTSVLNTYSFWLALGMLLYLGGCFFFNIMINYISEKEIDSYLFLTYIPEVLKNLFFSVAIYLYTKIAHKLNHKRTKSDSVPYLDTI